MKKNDIWISLAIITAAGLALLFYTQRKGFVGIDARGADAVLELKSSWIAQTTITSAVEPAKIGARIYRPQLLKLSMRQGGDTWRIESHGPWGDLSKIKVRNKEATALKLGPPFMIKPEINKNGSILSIDYAIIGQAGEQYENTVTKNNRAVTGAKIKILDETGNILESGSFKYGWGGTCRQYLWQVPKDFKGKYQIQVDIDIGPFEKKIEEIWFWMVQSS